MRVFPRTVGRLLAGSLLMATAAQQSPADDCKLVTGLRVARLRKLVDLDPIGRLGERTSTVFAQTLANEPEAAVLGLSVLLEFVPRGAQAPEGTPWRTVEALALDALTSAPAMAELRRLVADAADQDRDRQVLALQALARLGPRARGLTELVVERARSQVDAVDARLLFALAAMAPEHVDLVVRGFRLAMARRAPDRTLVGSALVAIARSASGELPALLAAGALHEETPEQPRPPGEVALRALFEAWNRAEGSDRAELLSLLAGLGADAAPLLVRVLEQKDENLRRQASRHLQDLGQGAWKAVPRMVELWPTAEPAMRLDLLNGLAAAGPRARSAVSMLLAAIASGLPDAEAIPITVALGRIGVPKRAELGNLLADPRPFVRGQGCLVVGHLGDAGLDLLPEVLQLAERDPEPRVRRDAVWAIGRAAPPQAPYLRAIHRALGSEDWLTTVNAKLGLQRWRLTETDLVRRLDGR